MEDTSTIVNRIRRIIVAYRKGELDPDDDMDNAVYALDAIESALSEC